MRRFIRIIDKAPAAVRKFDDDNPDNQEQARLSVKRNFDLRIDEDYLSLWLENDIDAVAVFAATKRDKCRRLQLLIFDEDVFGPSDTIRVQPDCDPHCIRPLHFGLVIDDMDAFPTRMIAALNAGSAIFETIDVADVQVRVVSQHDACDGYDETCLQDWSRHLIQSA